MASNRNKRVKILSIYHSKELLKRVSSELNENIIAESVAIISANLLQELHAKYQPDLIVVDNYGQDSSNAIYQFFENYSIDKAYAVLTKYTQGYYADSNAVEKIEWFIINILKLELHKLSNLSEKEIKERLRKIPLQINQNLVSLVADESITLKDQPRIYQDTFGKNNVDVITECLKNRNVNGTLCMDIASEKINLSYGFSHEEQNKKFNIDTNSDTCSVGKLFTVLTLFSYFPDSLNARVKDKLHPEIVNKLPIYIQQKLQDGITIKELIFHYAGLGDYLSVYEENKNRIVFNANTSLYDLLVQSFLEPALNTNAKRGEFTYSNTGYFILGLIIESAINPQKNPDQKDWQSYYHFIEETLFKNAGMQHTYYLANNKTAPNKMMSSPPCTSAGGWLSTSEDLYKLMQYVLKEYKENTTFQQLINIFCNEHPLFKTNGKHLFMHTGGLPGAHALAKLDIDKEKIFTYVTTSDVQIMDLFYLCGLHQVIDGVSLSEIVDDIKREKKMQNQDTNTFHTTAHIAKKLQIDPSKRSYVVTESIDIKQSCEVNNQNEFKTILDVSPIQRNQKLNR